MTRTRWLGREGPVMARVGMAAAAGVAGAVIVGTLAGWEYAPPVGWFVAAMVFIAWTWLIVGRMTPEETAAHATREDPTRRVTHVIVLLASVASLGGVGFLLVAQSSKSGAADSAAAVGIASVAASWLLVHTLYALRYAMLYYSPSVPGGVNFNQDEPPAYPDFAYLSFTLGMTYQVSDTDLQTRAIRSTALRQALLSYLLGAVVLAVTINLVASLGSSPK